MKFNAKTLLCAILAALMVVSLAAPAFAYQSAFKNGAAVTEFNDTAKAKMAAMKDGDNIMALGEYDTATYATPAAYSESGYAQLVYQHNDNKWGRALKGAGWSINGMMNVCDGVIDVAATGTKPANALAFCRKQDDPLVCDANGVTAEGAPYTILCGWEFADTFKVKGFKIYFSAEAYCDDFDILVGHLENDEIVWEIAHSATDIGTKGTIEAGFENNILSYSATFCKTMEGQFLQIATRGFEGMGTGAKSGYYHYYCTELEVYSGTTATKHAAAEAVAAVPATCVNTGISAHYACPACGQKYSDAAGTKAITADSVIVPATGIHTLSVVKTPASCSAAGLADYYTCANCDAIFADSEGKTAIALADVAVVPATGHKFVNGVCSSCGAACQTISNEAEFLAMDPAGIYAVAKDFTLSTTYNYIDPETSASVPFTGELIGNGHTITTTVPLFAQVGGGAFSDLTIAGEINVTGTDVYAAGLALRVTKNTTTTFTNITNKANVTGEHRTGGIVGQINADANTSATTTTTFINCANEGTITGSSMVGGICGYSQGAHDTFIDCTNKGNVTCVSGLAGGIIGRSAGDLGGASDTKNDGPKTFSIDFTNCVNDGDIAGTSNVGGIIAYAKATTINLTNCTNNGAVSSSGTDAGGILGHGGADKYYAKVTIIGCVNNGEITYTGTGNNGAGGLISYVYGSGDYGVAYMEDCENHGKITSTTFASQFISYTNQNNTVIKDCTGDGTLTATYPVIVGMSSADYYKYQISNVKISKDSGETLFSWATAEANVKNQIQLADYMANEDFKGNVSYIEDAILYGDANGDGFVDMKDLALVRAYIANFDRSTGTSVVAVQPGADCDGDGTVIAKDLMYLRAYIANYDQNTKSSTVVLGPQ